MWNSKKSATLSIIVCFIFLAVLTAAMFIGPFVAKIWFTVYRGLSPNGTAVQSMLSTFKWTFYPCSVFAYATLYSLIKLLFNIKNREIFIVKNVTFLRVISWCCFAVASITLMGGIVYLPFFAISVAAAFVGLMLRVVKNVMQNAIELKAENELTI